ncbi:MAG: DUF4435 domain-containing protein [Eubacteriales bacterium]|nr:DUF4435 domain-containing protein [Eubacteriales bacterium]
MAFTYYLPDANNKKEAYTTEENSVIIIGANGSGKSKLGAWIEQQEFSQVHRIGAQRNLNFNENITLKSYDVAEKRVFWGTDAPGHDMRKNSRWNWGHSYTTTLLNDFEDVLAALLAMQNNENDRFVKAFRASVESNSPIPDVPITAVDKLKQIWNTIFPQRELEVEDSRFYAILDHNGTKKRYPANQMSDGERSVLYLAAQVLCVPPNKTMIMDEPEIHLHRSIMTRMWTTLERFRPDCLFIYITHDTDFAAAHGTADKIWIQEYDGQNWKFQKLNSTDLPEDLLLEVLGSRKNILFVEGEKNSYDTQLYTELYSDYYVIPCGSCTQVIARTKVFRNNPTLHHCQVYGLIDRDFRSEYEIDKYKTDNIFTLNVAEVENLFLVEELIRWFAGHIGDDPETVFAAVKNYVINERFAKQIQGQVCQSVVAQIKYILGSAEISKKNETEAKASLNILLAGIDYEAIKTTEEARFEAAKNGSYADVIKAFNEKNIAKTVGRFFGLNNDVYCSKIVALVKGTKKAEIVAAIAPYLPPEIPRG